MSDTMIENLIPAFFTALTAIVGAYFTFSAGRRKSNSDLQQFYLDKVEDMMSRQTDEIKLLNKKLDNLTEENTTLKKLLNQVKEENKNLQSEVGRLRSLLEEKQ